MAGFIRRVRQPPPTGNHDFDVWIRDFAVQWNSHPRMSWFSGTTPNSNLTGSPGDIAINLASGSTLTRMWMMTGDASLVTTLGWRTISLGPA
jgi:hypothetical protein